MTHQDTGETQKKNDASAAFKTKNIHRAAVGELIRLACNSIIESEAIINLKVSPQVHNAIGKQVKFHLEAQRNDKTGITRCTIYRISNITDVNT